MGQAAKRKWAQRAARESEEADGKAAAGGKAGAGPVPVLPLHGSFGRNLANWLFPVFQLWIGLGWLVLRYGGGMPPGEPNGPLALFTSINAATLTGFTQPNGLDSYTPTGKVAMLVLMLGGSLFCLLVGALAVTRILRLRYSDWQVIGAAAITQITAVAVGTAALLFTGRDFLPSVFQATAAFGNCGLSIGRTISGVGDPSTHLVLLPLAFLGGLGLPVLMELFDRIFWRRPTSLHTQATVAMSMWVYVVGVALLLPLLLINVGNVDLRAFRGELAHVSALVLQSRTLGPLVKVPPVTGVGQWLVLLVMVIGGASAGTAGGLKVTTLYVLIRGIRQCLRGGKPGRIFGIAAAWTAMYMGIALAAVLLLSYVQHTTSADVIFLAVSAASNVGIGKVEDQTGPLYALCAIMLLGRMAPMMVLWWTAESTTDADVAVG